MNIRNIPVTSMLKVYNILQDEEGVNYVNIFRTYSLTETARNNRLLFATYTVREEAWWDNISYELYRNPSLWWVVAVANDVTNPFEELEEGDVIYAVKNEYIYNIFDSLSQLERL